MDAATIQAVAALSAVMVAAAGLLAGIFYWLHRDSKQDFQTESRRLDERIDRLEDKSDRNRDELREEMRSHRDELREEMRRGFDELAAQMRRNQAELLRALSGHTHDTDTGAAVFRELPAADDD